MSQTTIISSSSVPFENPSKAPTVDIAKSINVDYLQRKYAEERNKRLHDAGSAQYIPAVGEFQHFEDDPYVERLQRAAITKCTHVVVIGGGYGGLLNAVRLQQAGIEDVIIVEKAGGFGGTWYWNRYPGAACDVESYIYMPLLEELDTVPTLKYVGWKELLNHSEVIADKWNLRSKSLLQTRVTMLKWNDADSTWTVGTDRGDVLTTRFVVPTTGVLHKPKLPGVPGIHSFKGRSFHTSRWDYNYTGGNGEPGSLMDKLVDKKVGIIGTGATAIQVVPELAKTAKSLIVFQRTPSSVDVRNNFVTDVEWYKSLKPGWQEERRQNFISLTTGLPESVDLVDDAWTSLRHSFPAGHTLDGKTGVTDDVRRNMAMGDYMKMESLRARIETIVKDSETAENLKPWYNRMCKRPTFHDEYLQAYNQSNVTLVDTSGRGIEKITESGVVVDGHGYELDCLVYATGFEYSTSIEDRSHMKIMGRNDKSITEKWANGLSSLHGVMVNGFPNCFAVQVGQGSAMINFVHCLDEYARHIAHLVSECDRKHIVEIEPSMEAEEKWAQNVASMQGEAVLFLEQCTPGYYNREGKLDGLQRSSHTEFRWYLKQLKEWREGGMRGLITKTSI